MNHNTPLSPRPLRRLAEDVPAVLTLRQLQQHGVSPAVVAERCAPGGPWQQILPGVFLLRPGPPTSQERLHAAVLYARRAGEAAGPGAGRASGTHEDPGGTGRPPIPQQPGPDRSVAAESPGSAMITGLAALNLHGFASVPPLTALDRIDVLVPRTHRVRSAGCVSVVRAQVPPSPVETTGLPVAPVPRALADAVSRLDDPAAVRRLLTEAVRSGRCEAAALVRELGRARLLSRPVVMDAVESLHAESRALAEGRLYALVRGYGLPDPLWNVELWAPGGPPLGLVDAYWPEQGVAVEIDGMHRSDGGGAPGEFAGKRERLEQLGIMVVRAEPARLRERPDEQASLIRTALMAADDRESVEFVHVLPA